jgi:hypothetical protein
MGKAVRIWISGGGRADDGGRRYGVKTIETTIVVDEARRAILQVPSNVMPGTHRAIVVIEEAPMPPRPFRIEDFPRHEIPLVVRAGGIVPS